MAATHEDLRRARELIHGLQDIIAQQNTIFASHDDCDYFRNIYRQAQMQRPPDAGKTDFRIINSIKEPQKDSPVEVPKPIQLAQTKQPDLACVASEPLQSSNATSKETLDNSLCGQNGVFQCLPKMEPLSAPELGFTSIRKMFSRLFPQLVLLDDIPSDAKAHAVKERWKTQNQAASISLISFHESDWKYQFLTNLSASIEVVYGQAKLISAEEIEHSKQWETFLAAPNLKLVIICDYALWQMPELLRAYREVPNREERFLLKIPLMLLPDLTLYQKDPLLKRSLWKAICQKIDSL